MEPVAFIPAGLTRHLLEMANRQKLRLELVNLSTLKILPQDLSFFKLVSLAGADPAEVPPVVVLRDDEGRDYLLDGHHRVVVAYLKGDAVIPALVHDTLSREG